MYAVHIQRPVWAMCQRKAAKTTGSAYPMPNSSQLAFPMIFAPPAFNSSTAVASNGDVKSAPELEKDHDTIFDIRRSMPDEHVVGSAVVHMLSFIATVRLLKGPRGLGLSSVEKLTSALVLSFNGRT